MNELMAEIEVTAKISLGDLATDITLWTQNLSHDELIAFIEAINNRIEDEAFTKRLRKVLKREV